MDRGEIGRHSRNAAAKLRPDLPRNGLPYGAFPNLLDVIEHIVEHAVRQGSEAPPIRKGDCNVWLGFRFRSDMLRFVFSSVRHSVARSLLGPLSLVMDCNLNTRQSDLKIR
jgi:hypothetical protein